MKLKWRNLPAIVTLSSGAVVSIISIIQRFDLNVMLWMLVGVMFLFYIVSLIIRAILVKYFDEKEEKKSEGLDDASLMEEADSLDAANTNDNVGDVINE